MICVDILTMEYSNIKRVELGLWMLFTTKDAMLTPLRGSFVLMNNGVRCTSNDVEVLASFHNSAEVMLIKRGSKTASSVSVLDEVHVSHNIYHQLTALLKAKYDMSKNPFSLECASDGCTLLISAGVENEELGYTVKSPTGDAFVPASNPISDLTAGCKSIRSFSFKMTNETCEKDISVRRGQVEILREIAHYLNRTLVFCQLDAGGTVRRMMCLSSSACCEQREGRGKVVRFFKVPFNRLNPAMANTIYAIDTTVESLVAAGSLAGALGA